jgi:hypothetical protein
MIFFKNEDVENNKTSKEGIQFMQIAFLSKRYCIPFLNQNKVQGTELPSKTSAALITNDPKCRGRRRGFEAQNCLEPEQSAALITNDPHN